MIESDLKKSIESEKKAAQRTKIIYAKLETVESEKLYLNESIGDLNDIVKEKKQENEESKAKLRDLNTQVAHFKHEYHLSVQEMTDVKANFQKCYEKQADIKDRMMKYQAQVQETTIKLAGKILENVQLLRKVKRLEKKIRENKRDLELSDSLLKSTRAELKDFRSQNKTFKETLRENDVRFLKMKSELDKLLRERDLIANQMIRRTDENELLEKETSALKTSAERGKASYNDRLKDIKLMTNEIQNLRSQCNILKRTLENTTDMRHEVLQLHRKLNQERIKAKVFESETITPMNVHRWRKLKQFEPKTVDFLQKTQLLRRKVLSQSAQIRKCEKIIEAFKAKIELLEKEMNRRPGIEIQEKLLLTRVKRFNLIQIESKLTL